MKTIVFANQKGGVAKTTSTISIGSGLATRGYKVLMVDIDPQGHLARLLNFPKEPGVRRWYYDEEPLQKCITEVRPKLWLLAGNKSTDKVLGKIKDESFGEEAFANALRKAAQAAQFDVVVIDLAPSLNNLQVAALIAADHVIIPSRMYLADLDGVEEVCKSLAQISQHGHKPSYVILPTLYERSSGQNEQERLLRDTVAHFPGQVWPPIVKDVHVGEAPARGKTIWEYAPTTNAVIGYEDTYQGRPVRIGGYADTLHRVISWVENV